VHRPSPRKAAALTLGALLSCAVASLGLAACAGAGAAGPAGPAAPPAAPSGLSAEAARETLARFAGALEAGRWPEAWSLLSPRWRAATTPERLAADWRGAGPVAREAAARVAALLASGAALDGTPGQGGGAGGGEVLGPLRLPVGPGRAARLVADGGRWSVDALE